MKIKLNDFLVTKGNFILGHGETPSSARRDAGTRLPIARDLPTVQVSQFVEYEPTTQRMSYRALVLLAAFGMELDV